MALMHEWETLIYQRDPALWIDQHIRKSELNQSFQLFAHQREILKAAFAFNTDGILPFDTILLSTVKKSGKTALLACLSLWWALTQEAEGEIYVIASDLEQAMSRAFSTIVRMLKYNPAIDPTAVITQREVKLSNGSVIRALATEYAGAAGSNHSLTCWDELWAYTREASVRMYEELTPTPTRRNSIRLITTYAGFESESKLLKELYIDGVDRDEHPEGRGIRIHPELPLYANEESRLFVYWDHEPRLPWQTPRYYTAQRRSLRPAQYLRFHENRWSTSSEVFITPELWDSCVDPEHRPLLPTRSIPIYVGVDLSTKHDSTAMVAVGFVERDGQTLLALAMHRIWKPSPDDPMDFESSVEQTLREWHAGYAVQSILVDPWQAFDLISRLQRDRLRIEAFPQTVSNLTRAGQALFDLLNGRNLVIYPNADLRQQALNTVAVESARGWRIAKEKSSRKVDSMVALSFACVAALDGQVHTGKFLPVGT